MKMPPVVGYGYFLESPIMEIRGHGGITHFGNSEGRGELKCGSRPWYIWYGYFLELPISMLKLVFCSLPVD